MNYLIDGIGLPIKYTRMEAGRNIYTTKRNYSPSWYLLSVFFLFILKKIYLSFTEHSTNARISTQEFQFTTAGNHWWYSNETLQDSKNNQNKIIYVIFFNRWWEKCRRTAERRKQPCWFVNRQTWIEEYEISTKS